MKSLPFTPKPLTLIAFVLVAAVSFGQDESKKVRFESRAKPVPSVLRELSKSCGKKLEASSGFDNVPLILAVHDVALQDVLDRIAKVTLGKWDKGEGGYRLEIDKDAWTRLEETEYQQRLTGFTSAIKEYLDAHAGDDSWTSDKVVKMIQAEKESRQKLLDDLTKNNPNLATSKVFVNKSSTRSMTPATPALFEVLRRLPASVLAKIQPGQRMVMSSSPTASQVPLPFPSSPVLNKFVDSHNLLASMVKSTGRGPENVTIKGGLDLDAKPISGQLAKMLVVLSRRSNDNGVSVEVKFADADGAYVGTAGRWFQPKPSDPLEASKINLSNEKAISFSPLSLELAKALLNSLGQSSNNNNKFAVRSNDGGSFTIGSNSPTPAPALSNEAMSSLVDPVNQDPQSTFVSDGILGVADAASKSVIACLPDSAISRLARSAASSPKPADFVTAAQEGGTLVEQSDQWLVMTAIDRLKSGPDQMNRVAAKRLFSTVASKGYARLQQLAQFAQNMGVWPRTTNYSVVALRLLDPYVASDLVEGIQSQAPLFQFLGTLDASLFEGVVPEAKFSVASLNQGQKGYLNRVVFGADGFSGIIGEGDMTSVSISDDPNQKFPDSSPGLYDDPTEVMPNGLPLQGGIVLQFKPQEFVRAQVRGLRGGQFLTAGGLGGTFAFQNSANIPEMVTKIPSYNSFTESLGNVVTMVREFVKDKKQSTEYTDAWIKPGALPVAFDSLSASFKEAVAKAKTAMSGSTVRLGQQDRPPQD